MAKGKYFSEILSQFPKNFHESVTVYYKDRYIIARCLPKVVIQPNSPKQRAFKDNIRMLGEIWSRMSLEDRFENWDNSFISFASSNLLTASVNWDIPRFLSPTCFSMPIPEILSCRWEDNFVFVKIFIPCQKHIVPWQPSIPLFSEDTCEVALRLWAYIQYRVIDIPGIIVAVVDKKDFIRKRDGDFVIEVGFQSFTGSKRRWGKEVVFLRDLYLGGKMKLLCDLVCAESPQHSAVASKWSNEEVVELPKVPPTKTALAIYKTVHSYRKKKDELYKRRNCKLIRSRSRKWRPTNYEIMREYCKSYYIKNRERILAQHKAWQDKNKDKVRKCQKKRYLKNREQVLAKQKEYQRKNKDNYLVE